LDVREQQAGKRAGLLLSRCVSVFLCQVIPFVCHYLSTAVAERGEGIRSFFLFIFFDFIHFFNRRVATPAKKSLNDCYSR